MKNIIGVLVLIAVGPAYAAGKLSCVGKTASQAQSVFAELLANGLVSQGAEFESQGGGLDDDSSTAVREEQLQADENILVTKQTISRNGRATTDYSLSVTGNVQSNDELIEILASVVENAKAGLSDKDAQSLDGCFAKISSAK